MRIKVIAVTTIFILFVFFTFFFPFKPAYADSGITIKGNISIYNFENGSFIDSSYGDFSNFGTNAYVPFRNAYIEIEFSEWTISDIKTTTDENGNFSVNVRNPYWGSWHVDIEVNSWVELDYNSGEPITADCFEDSEDLFKYNFQTGGKSVGKNGTLIYDVKIGGPDNNIEDYWDADITSLWDEGAGTGLNHVTAAFMSQVIKDGFDWLVDRNATAQDLDRTTCILFPSDETGILGIGASNIDKYKPMQLPPGTGHIHIIPKRLFPSQYTIGDSLKPVGYYWKDLRCTLLHEYGHKVMHDIYWDLPKPLTFWDSFDAEHTVYTCRSPELGWVEGWAEFFSAAVQNWPTINGEKDFSAINIEQTGTIDMSDYATMTVKPQEEGQIKWHRELSAPYYNDKRNMNEGEVASVLWDIFDSKGWEYMSNEVQNMKPVAWQNQSFLQWYDRLEDPNLDRIWSIMRDHSPDCLMDEADAQSLLKIEDSFWYYWLEKYGNDSQLVHGLKAVLYNRGIPSTKKKENAPRIVSSSIDIQKHKANIVIEELDPEDQSYLYYNVEYRASPYEESKMMYNKDKLLSSLSTAWTGNRITISINIPPSSQWSTLLLRVHDSMLPVFQEYTNYTTTDTSAETGDKGDLIIAGSSNIPNYVTDLEIIDKYVHLVDGSKGYYIIDVTDPGRPTKVASFEDWKRCPSIDIEDYYAYIPNLSGDFHIVDIADPLNPQETACINLYDSVKKLPGRNIAGALFDISVAGDYAYIIGYNCFYTVDISDKYNPVLAGFMAIGGDYLDVLGNYAFITDNDWGLHVFDITDPAKPSEVCYYSFKFDHKGHSAFQITIDPDLMRAYIYCDANGFAIIDISDPLNPALISSIDVPQSVNHGALKNNHIYIIEDDALYIISASSPEKPAEIKPFTIPPDGDRLYPNFLAAYDDYIYAGTSYGLVIFGYKNQ
jgi:hypothetical protein